MDDLGDRGAVDTIMGHENPNDMRTHYVEEMNLNRLRRVVNRVYNWLYPREPWPRREEKQDA